MANELEVRADGVAGAITDNPLSSSATTFNSAGLADLPAIGSTQFAKVTLFARDANGRVTAREVVYVTAHTASATSATIVRGREGTTGVSWATGSFWTHGLTSKDLDGAGGGSGIIGLVNYSPGTQVQTFTSSTSYAAVDSTNLAVSFTVPPSGKVLIRLSGYAAVASNTVLSWGLMESATVLAGGNTMYNATANIEGHAVAEFLITGLTAGASKTYLWAHARPAGSGTAETRYGGTTTQAGPAIMTVTAVNV